MTCILFICIAHCNECITMAPGPSRSISSSKPQRSYNASGWTKSTQAPVRARSFSSHKPERRCRSNGTVQSRVTSGLFTASGTPVHDVTAYTNTGAPVFNAYGKRIASPEKYESVVRLNSMATAAEVAAKKHKDAKAFTYELHMQGGKKYVGYTVDPERRLVEHLVGVGASATELETVQQIKIRPHKSVHKAKRAETDTYYALKDQYGVDRVRGAGHTRKFEE